MKIDAKEFIHHQALHHQAAQVPVWLQFWRDENGASYSLSVAMMIPILIGFICLAIETTLLFISQQSINTATQTATHVGQAWLGHQEMLQQDGESLESIMKQAVARTLTPFASAKADGNAGDDDQLLSLLAELGLSDTASHRLANKEQSLAKSTRVTVTSESRSTSGWLIRVEVDVPLWTPFVSPLFQNATTSNGGAARVLACEVWVPLSELDIRRTRIGIPYSPRHAAAWPD